MWNLSYFAHVCYSFHSLIAIDILNYPQLLEAKLCQDELFQPHDLLSIRDALMRAWRRDSPNLYEPARKLTFSFLDLLVLVMFG